MAPRTLRKKDFQHLPPRKMVLLLSCMDARLLDDTVSFMNEYNLQNRYDHVVFAGAALGVLRMSSPPVTGPSQSAGSVWMDVFFHHLQTAIDMLGRQIKDIFILEHRDCGAYQHYHPGSVEKSRQRCSRHFSVLTYSAYAPRVKRAAALLDGLF